MLYNGSHADWYTVYAKTDKEAGHRGISAFVVPRDAGGNLEAEGLCGLLPQIKRAAHGVPARAIGHQHEAVGAGNVVEPALPQLAGPGDVPQHQSQAWAVHQVDELGVDLDAYRRQVGLGEGATDVACNSTRLSD